MLSEKGERLDSSVAETSETWQPAFGVQSSAADTRSGIRDFV